MKLRDDYASALRQETVGYFAAMVSPSKKHLNRGQSLLDPQGNFFYYPDTDAGEGGAGNRPSASQSSTEEEEERGRGGGFGGSARTAGRMKMSATTNSLGSTLSKATSSGWGPDRNSAKIKRMDQKIKSLDRQWSKKRLDEDEKEREEEEEREYRRKHRILPECSVSTKNVPRHLGEISGAFSSYGAAEGPGHGGKKNGDETLVNTLKRFGIKDARAKLSQYKTALLRYTQWKSPICPPDPMDATTRRNTDRNSGLFAGNVVHGNGVVTIEKDFEDGFEAKRRMYQETTPVDERSLNGLEDTSNPLTKVRDVHAERRESERQAKAKAERDRDNKYLEAYREESRILSGEPSVELEKENADSKDAGIFTKDETKKVRFADGVNPAEDENFDLEIRGNKRGVAVTRMRVADVENNYVDKITGLSAQLKRLDSTSSLGSVHSEERMQVVDKMRTIEKFRRSNSSLAALEELDANGKPLDSTSALDEGEMSVEDYQKSLGRDLAASRQRDVLMRKNARQQRQQRDFGENVEVVADEGEQPDADGFLKKPLPLPIRPFFLGLYTAIGGIYCVVVVNQEASEKYGDMTFASWTEANCRIGSFTDKCSVCTDSEECGMSADALYSNGCQFEILIKYGDSHQDRAEGRWLPEWDFVENEYRLMPREHFGECPGGKSTDPPTLRLPRAQMNLRENCCLYYDKTRDLFCDMWSFGSKDGFWPCRVSEDSLQYESRAQQEGEVPPFASKWIFGHNKTEYFTYAGLLLAVTLLFWKVWRWPAVLCHKYNEQIGAYKNAKKKWEEEETKRRAIAKMKAAGISGDDEDGAFGGRKGSSQKMFYYADPPTDSDSNYELDPEALNDLRGAIEQGFSGKTKMKKGKLPKGLLSPPKKPGQRSLADPDATYAYDSSKNPYRPDHLNFSGHSDVADRRYSDAQRPGSRDKTAGSRATRADRLAESFRLLAGQTASLLFGRQSGSGQEAARSWNDRRVIQAGDLSFASRGAYADREEEGGDSYDRERPPLNPAISHAERKKELEYADGAAALSGVPPPDANRASRDQKSNWTSFGGFRNKSEHLVPLPENLKEQKSTVIRMEDSKELFKRTGVLPEKRSNVYENLDKLQNRGSWSANSFAPASAQPGFREAVRARNSGGLAEASSAEENFDFANENNHPFRSKSSSKETTSSKETHLTSASAASSSQQSQKYNDLGEFAAAQQMNRSKEGKPSYYPSPNKARVRGSDFGPGNPGPGAAYYDHGIGLEQAIGSELVPKITRKELRTRSPLKARVEAGGILGENELRQMLEKKRQPPVKNLFAAKFRSGGGSQGTGAPSSSAAAETATGKSAGSAASSSAGKQSREPGAAAGRTLPRIDEQELLVGTAARNDGAAGGGNVVSSKTLSDSPNKPHFVEPTAQEKADWSKLVDSGFVVSGPPKGAKPKIRLQAPTKALPRTPHL